jgi:hypothetical protein
MGRSIVNVEKFGWNLRVLACGYFFGIIGYCPAISRRKKRERQSKSFFAVADVPVLTGTQLLDFTGGDTIKSLE